VPSDRCIGGPGLVRSVVLPDPSSLPTAASGWSP